MQTLAVAIPMLLLMHGNARAATPSACEPTAVSTLDQRLAAKADEGLVPLRRFIERTRMIYQLDMADALKRVNQRREAERACTVAMASRS
jgi:hypothetical protein